jgi:uncharacterized membrane protein YeaQ/YmgE (transglycosylase-associated protein family)
MFPFICIFVGLVAGWLAGRSLEGERYGPSVDIAMGIAGALIGGSLMRSFGFSGFAGTALTTLVAITCAALLTTLTALGNGRRIHSRAI